MAFQQHGHVGESASIWFLHEQEGTQFYAYLHVYVYFCLVIEVSIISYGC